MVSLCTLAGRSSGGRGFRGRITVRRRGGGLRRRLRPLVGFSVPLRDRPGWLVSNHLAALDGGWLVRLVRPQGLRVGFPFGWSCSGAFGRRPGSGSPLIGFPPGSPLHLVEAGRGRSLSLARAPGSSARLLRHYRHPLSPRRGTSLVRLPSGRLRLFPSGLLAGFGTPAVRTLLPTPRFRAGDSRLRGRRPAVRGVAMNPVDHPHGGGQGKTAGGRPSSSPWGVYTKGVRTRSRRRPSNRFLVASSR
jgi:large subunit ribosomal protein L2